MERRDIYETWQLAETLCHRARPTQAFLLLYSLLHHAPAHPSEHGSIAAVVPSSLTRVSFPAYMKREELETRVRAVQLLLFDDCVSSSSTTAAAAVHHGHIECARRATRSRDAVHEALQLAHELLYPVMVDRDSDEQAGGGASSPLLRYHGNAYFFNMDNVMSLVWQTGSFTVRLPVLPCGEDASGANSACDSSVHGTNSDDCSHTHTDNDDDGSGGNSSGARTNLGITANRGMAAVRGRHDGGDLASACADASSAAARGVASSPLWSDTDGDVLQYDFTPATASARIPIALLLRAFFLAATVALRCGQPRRALHTVRAAEQWLRVVFASAGVHRSCEALHEELYARCRKVCSMHWEDTRPGVEGGSGGAVGSGDGEPARHRHDCRRSCHHSHSTRDGVAWLIAAMRPALRSWLSYEKMHCEGVLAAEFCRVLHRSLRLAPSLGYARLVHTMGTYAAVYTSLCKAAESTAYRYNTTASSRTGRMANPPTHGTVEDTARPDDTKPSRPRDRSARAAHCTDDDDDDNHDGRAHARRWAAALCRCLHPDCFASSSPHALCRRPLAEQPPRVRHDAALQTVAVVLGYYHCLATVLLLHHRDRCGSAAPPTTTSAAAAASSGKRGRDGADARVAVVRRDVVGTHFGHCVRRFAALRDHNRVSRGRRACGGDQTTEGWESGADEVEEERGGGTGRRWGRCLSEFELLEWLFCAGHGGAYNGGGCLSHVRPVCWTSPALRLALTHFVDLWDGTREERPTPCAGAGAGAGDVARPSCSTATAAAAGKGKGKDDGASEEATARVADRFVRLVACIDEAMQWHAGGAQQTAGCLCIGGGTAAHSVDGSSSSSPADERYVPRGAGGFALHRPTAAAEVHLLVQLKAAALLTMGGWRVRQGQWGQAVQAMVHLQHFLVLFHPHSDAMLTEMHLMVGVMAMQLGVHSCDGAAAHTARSRSPPHRHRRPAPVADETREEPPPPPRPQTERRWLTRGHLDAAMANVRRWPRHTSSATVMLIELIRTLDLYTRATTAQRRHLLTAGGGGDAAADEGGVFAVESDARSRAEATAALRAQWSDMNHRHVNPARCCTAGAPRRASTRCDSASSSSWTPPFAERRTRTTDTCTAPDWTSAGDADQEHESSRTWHWAAPTQFQHTAWTPTNVILWGLIQALVALTLEHDTAAAAQHLTHTASYVQEHHHHHRSSSRSMAASCSLLASAMHLLTHAHAKAKAKAAGAVDALAATEKDVWCGGRVAKGDAEEMERRGNAAEARMLQAALKVAMGGSEDVERCRCGAEMPVWGAEMMSSTEETCRTSGMGGGCVRLDARQDDPGEAVTRHAYELPVDARDLMAMFNFLPGEERYDVFSCSK